MNVIKSIIWAHEVVHASLIGWSIGHRATKKALIQGQIFSLVNGYWTGSQ